MSGPATVVPIRVVLPAHLRGLAGITGEVTLAVAVETADGGAPLGGEGAGSARSADGSARSADGSARSAGGRVTQRCVLDALEAAYPALGGTVRDRATGKRRPFIRFFACEEDLSHDPPDAPLPDAVVRGAEPFIVLGAIAGGCG